MARVIGWDVGGAHLKAALAEDGEIVKVWRVSTPLHHDLEPLERALAAIAGEAGAADRQAITVTGELSDVFPARAEGVAAVAALLESRLGANLLFYAGAAGLVATAEDADAIASANWHAAARLVAERMDAALFLDMGSTTTDITVVAGGEVEASGFGDAARLACGELVYQGFERTALMAVAERVPFAGRTVPVIAEALATVADLRRVTGWTDDSGEADGGSVAASRARLARMIGRDPADASPAAFAALAGAFTEAQLRRIHDAALLVLSRGGLDAGAPAVVAGVGRSVLKRLATRLDRGVVDFADLVECRSPLRDDVDRAAPAVALALIASKS